MNRHDGNYERYLVSGIFLPWALFLLSKHSGFGPL